MPSGSDPLARWRRRWEAAIAAAARHGQDDGTAWGPARLLVGTPASSRRLRSLERSLSSPLPDGLRRVLSLASHFEASWHFDESVEPPREFRQLFAGTCRWDIDDVGRMHETYREWVAKVFPDPTDAYHRIWHDRFPFLHVPNDDLVAISVDGSVVYLSHDDGEGHGYRLGTSVEDFLDRWTSLGCPGPEDWQWLPFTTGRESLLDPRGASAARWKAWFGLEDEA